MEFWAAHIHPEDFPRLIDLHQQLNDGRLERVSIAYRYVHPARGVIWLEQVTHVIKRHAAGQAQTTIGVQQAIRDALLAYLTTLPSAYESLARRFTLRDAAIKVVGVGSVGTHCWVLLFTAVDGDPLFLQVKEARGSVLEPHAGKSVFPNHGQRVVDGYRRMQPASDMFLGWSRGPKRDFFVRQLRDMKIGPMVETFGQPEMDIYAGWCGKALALSHARSGNSAMLSGYMGKSDALDQAIAAFSKAYADQNEKDHAALDRAVRTGTVKAVFEEER